MVAGVCGGIAEYFDMDPTIVRLIAVLLTVVGNAAAVVAYLVIWVAVPEGPDVGASAGSATPASATPVAPPEPEADGGAAPAPQTPAVSAPKPTHTQSSKPTFVQSAAPIVKEASGRGTMLFGLALVLLGLVFIAEVFIPGLNIWQLWPLILVGLGLRMIITGKGD